MPRGLISDLRELLDYPLVNLAAGTVTLGSLFTIALVVALARLFARFTNVAIGRVFTRRGVSEGTSFAVQKITGYAITVLGVVIAISSVGFNLDALLAASAVLLVGIGFGLQRVAENFVAGFILLIEQPIKNGDFIKTGDTFGWVKDIGVRATRVVTRDEVTIIIPNSELISTPVVNHSAPTSRLRVIVNVGVAYGSDTVRVREALLGVAKAHRKELADDKAEVRFEDFGDSSLNFSLLVWIPNPAEDRRLASVLRFAIDKAFRETGIQIPFPQRDLHLKTGFDFASGSAG